MDVFIIQSTPVISVSINRLEKSLICNWVRVYASVVISLPSIFSFYSEDFSNCFHTCIHI